MNATAEKTWEEMKAENAARRARLRLFGRDWEYEVNGYHDSDFKALAWDPAEEALTTVEIGSTRYANGWLGPDDFGGSATDEDMEAALAWWNEKRLASTMAAAARKARIPAKGSRVVAVKGFKPRNKDKVGFAPGMTGEVIWVGKESTFDGFSSPSFFRFGVKFDDMTDAAGDPVVVFARADKFRLENADDVADDAARAAAERFVFDTVLPHRPLCSLGASSMAGLADEYAAEGKIYKGLAG